MATKMTLGMEDDAMILMFSIAVADDDDDDDDVIVHFVVLAFANVEWQTD